MFKYNIPIHWNKNIKKEILEEFGFKNRLNGKRFYLMRYLEDSISLNITYKVKDDALEIDVLDERFLQPYDYQYILHTNPNFPFAKTIKNKVDNILGEIQELGIITGFNSQNYIYSIYKNGKCLQAY